MIEPSGADDFTGYPDGGMSEHKPGYTVNREGTGFGRFSDKASLSGTIADTEQWGLIQPPPPIAPPDGMLDTAANARAAMKMIADRSMRDGIPSDPDGLWIESPEQREQREAYFRTQRSRARRWQAEYDHRRRMGRLGAVVLLAAALLLYYVLTGVFA